MALDLRVTYDGQVVHDNPDYPLGQAVNVGVEGDGNGFPLEKTWINDHLGFQQALLTEAGIEPSGVPDTAIASQYFQALESLFAPDVQEFISASPATWTKPDHATFVEITVVGGGGSGGAGGDNTQGGGGGGGGAGQVKRARLPASMLPATLTVERGLATEDSSVSGAGGFSIVAAPGTTGGSGTADGGSGGAGGGIDGAAGGAGGTPGGADPGGALTADTSSAAGGGGGGFNQSGAPGGRGEHAVGGAPGTDGFGGSPGLGYGAGGGGGCGAENPGGDGGGGGGGAAGYGLDALAAAGADETTPAGGAGGAGAQGYVCITTWRSTT